MALDSRPRSRLFDALDRDEPVFGTTVLTASRVMTEAIEAGYRVFRVGWIRWQLRR